MTEEKKKTGATPIVAIGDLGGGKVQGVTPVTTILVKYTDGHGKKEVRLAAVIPGGEIYFFTNNAIDTRPAQQWLKTAILEHLAEVKKEEIRAKFEEADQLGLRISRSLVANVDKEVFGEIDFSSFGKTKQ